MAKREATHEPPGNRRGLRAVPAKYWLAGLGGVALHLAVLPLSERAYYGDHDDFLRWGIKAADGGVLTLYDGPPPRWPGRRQSAGQWVIYERPVDLTCNYPPIAAYVLWMNGELHKRLDPKRTINTITSRALFMTWGVVAVVVVAAGVAAIVHLIRPTAAWWAFVIALCFPPLVYDTAVWTQTDAWLLAPAVWMVRSLMQRRWLLAGVLWGVMLGIKPQAILFAPAMVVAAVVHREWWRLAVALACAVGVLLLVATPFMLKSGLSWFEHSYRRNLLEAYPDTTLRAYNVWYVDLLISKDRDASRTLLGLTKDAWGKALLAAGLAALTVAVWRRRSDARWAILAWTALSLLASVMLPTRVHERYVVTAIPFAIAAAMCRPMIWVGLAPLTVVTMAQLTSYDWLTIVPEYWGLFLKQKELLYEHFITQQRAQEVSPVSTMEEFLTFSRSLYDFDRRKYVALEWGLTVMALVASGLIACLMLRGTKATRSHASTADVARPRRAR